MAFTRSTAWDIYKWKPHGPRSVTPVVIPFSSRQAPMRVKLRTLFLITLLSAVLLALAFEQPYERVSHGSFNVAESGEITVYEFYESAVDGSPALPGKWNVEGQWLNSSVDHWLCFELTAKNDAVEPADILWEQTPRSCGVNGSMTAVFDSSYVREHTAFPISVPWQSEALGEDDAAIGEFDEFWDLRRSLILTEYGVILQAGNGDDGSFTYYLGRNADDMVCAVRCVLEDDLEYWTAGYYKAPMLQRFWMNLKRKVWTG